MIEAPEPKLPPIMVRYTDNLKDQIAEISNQFEDDVRIKFAGEQLKIFPQTLIYTERSLNILLMGKSNSTSSPLRINARLKRC
ncbi:hypothetical protein CEXT_214341 [Caerostris extrusa]|uniref:Uncharacterized protein n=1 Tax=Caerostris extrusa TaxID=172846 RepID=A0AAV4YEZ4_CAEEX|nr:hypothetical protein CEXT_214341 [Caerostris extrusa]